MAEVMTVLRRLEKHGFGVLPDNRIQTASIGVAGMQEDKVNTALELIKLADERMYEAKKGGRNAVVTKTERFQLVAGDNQQALKDNAAG